jgi:hypothetical protein
MGFAINRHGFSAVADDPYLEGCPLGGVFENTMTPHQEQRNPVGSFHARFVNAGMEWAS